jgi:mRNA degradation ribonuclease J1/J2
LAESGIFFAVVKIGKDGRIIGKPEFVSRGFANLNGTPDLSGGVEETIARTANTYYNDSNNLSSHISSAIERYLYAETGRRPMVFAVVQ